MIKETKPKYAHYTDVEDPILWQKFKEGEEAVLDFIYSQYLIMLYNYGLKIVSDSALVEDCIQELFIELWQRRTFLGNTNCIKFYLLKALKRKILKKHPLSISTIKESYPKGYHFEVIFSYETQCIHQELVEEQKVKLKGALESLSSRQQEVVYLKFYHKLTYNQIAEVMEIEKSAVYTLLFKAIKKLRKSLKRAHLYALLGMITLLIVCLCSM